MSTILLHMMLPYCEFRMHVWNVLHVARWKYRTQKLRKNAIWATGFAYWLRHCTDVAQRWSTKLSTMFGRLLGWYTISTLWGLLLPNGILYQVQNSLCVQVLCSPILAVLLHGIRAVGISPLRRGIMNGITNYETFAPRHFQQRAPPIFRGRPSHWA